MSIYDGKHTVTLEFLLDEEVTPHLFAAKVAMACARGGALRMGEAIDSGVYVFKYEEDVILEDPPFNGIEVPHIIQIGLVKDND